jgi:hypothetical protein
MAEIFIWISFKLALEFLLVVEVLPDGGAKPVKPELVVKNAYSIFV